MKEDLRHHSFVQTTPVNRVNLYSPSNMKYSHPLPAKDEGQRFLNIISPHDSLSESELANIIAYSNTKAVDNFFQELRRHLNLLERPLVGTRVANAYIYTNYNPQYAHMLLTIFRTYYNFIKPRKYYDKIQLTPAQRIGIVDRIYEYKDIVYFR